MTRKTKKPNVPVAVEREVVRLRSRIEALENACKMAHDTLADVSGALGPCNATVGIDPTFRELVRVLFIDK